MATPTSTIPAAWASLGSIESFHAEFERRARTRMRDDPQQMARAMQVSRAREQHRSMQQREQQAVKEVRL